jgi:hypothetical protein
MNRATRLERGSELSAPAQAAASSVDQLTVDSKRPYPRRVSAVAPTDLASRSHVLATRSDCDASGNALSRTRGSPKGPVMTALEDARRPDSQDVFAAVSAIDDY